MVNPFQFYSFIVVCVVVRITRFILKRLFVTKIGYNVVFYKLRLIIQYSLRGFFNKSLVIPTVSVGWESWLTTYTIFLKKPIFFEKKKKGLRVLLLSVLSINERRGSHWNRPSNTYRLTHPNRSKVSEEQLTD